MTDKDIQQLIDKYLDGTTTPAEESLLARSLYRRGKQDGDMPADWQTVRLMLGEWAMGEAEYDEIMSERQQNSHRITPLGTQHGGRRWRKLAVAASLLLSFGIGATLWFKGDKSSGTDILTQKTQGIGTGTDSLSVPTTLGEKDSLPEPSLPPSPSQGERPLLAKNTSKNTHAQTGSHRIDNTPSNAEVVENIPTNESQPVNPYLIEASAPHLTHQVPPSFGGGTGEAPGALRASLSADTTYKDPAKMDDFIAKMAAYNKVEEVPLECTSGRSDTAVVSVAYVFPDKEEINLFARLLQAACSYEDTTPGYHLNFTHQQFFFSLEDPKNKLKYLWIAERITGDRILLFKTHSPVGKAISAACYQDYRDRITHTRFSSLNY